MTLEELDFFLKICSILHFAIQLTPWPKRREFTHEIKTGVKIDPSSDTNNAPGNNSTSKNLTSVFDQVNKSTTNSNISDTDSEPVLTTKNVTADKETKEHEISNKQ